MVERIFSIVGRAVIKALEEAGGLLLLGLRVIYLFFFPPYRVRLFLKQMEFIGAQSIFIITLTGLFTGMVFALQSSHAFKLFRAEYLIGPTVVLALTRELSPVLSALMVTGRAGSAMAAELGTMKVTEQIDALWTMAVEPVHYLAVPRVVASTFAVPMLSIVFSFIGTLGCYIVTVGIVGVTPQVFIDQVKYYVETSDMWMGIKKAFFFGYLIGVISCYNGMKAEGGARGVGMSATHSVVLSSVLIFLSDYLLTAFMT